MTKVFFDRTLNIKIIERMGTELRKHIFDVSSTYCKLLDYSYMVGHEFGYRYLTKTVVNTRKLRLRMVTTEKERGRRFPIFNPSFTGGYSKCKSLLCKKKKPYKPRLVPSQLTVSLHNTPSL